MFLLIYELSEPIQRPIKILIFSLDLPVYLSDAATVIAGANIDVQ